MSPVKHRPGFDRPVLTVPASDVLSGLGLRMDEQPPIPRLIEPSTMPRVTDPVVENLVPIVHRRIRTLSNYWHAGWSRARPTTLMRSGAFDRLAGVADALPDRFGLAVFDAWRPLDLQAELFDAAYADHTLPPGFVSDPNPDPMTPPPHLTGGTVDVTLTVDGIALAPASGFDDFTDGAHADALESRSAPEASIDRDVRRMLYWHMRAAGFVVLQQEWWHFEYGTRRWAAITEHAPLYGPASAT